MEIGNLIIRSPIAKALAIIGDVWTFRILQEIFLGHHRFETFINNTGASRATLSKRLQSLINHNILEKRVYQQTPVRYEYHLTKKGAALFEFFQVSWQWERKWSTDENQPIPKHSACGNPMDIVLSCNHCQQEIEAASLNYRPGPGIDTAPIMNFGEVRRAKKSKEDKQRNLSAGEVLSDRWTPFVLATALFGLHRFDEMQQQLSIATNILSDRLKLLVESGLLEKLAYQSNPVRYEYKLTDKGKDFYKMAITLNQWGEQWLLEGEESALILYHHCSNEPIKTKLSCRHCQAPITPPATQATTTNAATTEILEPS